MPTSQLPFPERLMLNIDRLVQARVKLHTEESRDQPYRAQVESAEKAVKSAQYALLMSIDNLKLK